MEARRYRSIPELLEGTEYVLVSASDIAEPSNRNNKHIWCEEHYQLLYTMVELEGKTPQQVSDTLPFSLDMIVDILNLDPVYRIMKKERWLPADKCSGKTVVSIIQPNEEEAR